MTSLKEELLKSVSQRLLQRIGEGEKLYQYELNFLIDNNLEEYVFNYSVKSMAIVNLQNRYFAIKYIHYHGQSQMDTRLSQPYEVVPVQETRWVWEPKGKKIDEED